MNPRKPITADAHNAPQTGHSALKPNSPGPRAQQPAPTGRPDIIRTKLFVCPNCQYENWKKFPDDEKIIAPLPCPTCGHELQMRTPVRVDLSAEENGLLRWLSNELGQDESKTFIAGLIPLAREVVAKKSARGKKPPQWLADLLQNNRKAATIRTEPPPTADVLKDYFIQTLYKYDYPPKPQQSQEYTYQQALHQYRQNPEFQRVVDELYHAATQTPWTEEEQPSYTEPCN